ncbi:MAG TPA: ABC transporter permease [Bryobacteraceae bacterium]|nr:ABC transporter permease [Bryobacteraceae bacterium]
MRKLTQDLIFAFRQMAKSPGFTTTAMLSLAFGIGATTAVFSVVYAVLINPYPFPDADRMVHLILKDKAGNDRWPGLTGPQIRQLRQVAGIQSVVGQQDWNLTTTGEELPEDVLAVYLTSNAGTHFGLPALMGRGLLPSDAPNDHDPQPVVVLGYKFWQRHFSADPAVLRRTLQLVHKTYTIVGVMPPRFAWGDADVYLPLELNQDSGTIYQAYLKLRPGISHQNADAQLQPLLDQFAKETPAHFPTRFRVAVQGLNDRYVARFGHTLFLLLGAVGLLLVIGCANVSILLLARGAARQHELSVRAAIGASRGRILRQLLTESLALAVAGTALGVLLAYRVLALIVNWLPEYSFPHEAAIHINIPVLLFSVALALVTAVLFGFSPALQLSRPELARMIEAGTRRTTGSARGKHQHGLLIASQVALTLLLLTAAGAAIKGFLALMHIHLGYDPRHTMSVGIPVHDNTYRNWADRSEFFEQIRAHIAAMPGVAGAGISTNATPPDNGWNTHFEILGQSVPDEQQARTNFISPEYFTVLHIPLLAGRTWDYAESMRGARVALINQTMARQYWPLGDAIGQQIRIPQLKADPPYSPSAPDSDHWLEVIGIVGDARDDGLRQPVQPGIYVPYTMKMWMYTQILVRTRGAPLALLRAVRTEVHAVSADQQVQGRVRSLEEWITSQPDWAQERLVMMLFSAFAGLALALSLLGLYSVVSYIVAQRTNEFGIRLALGAGRAQVVGLVFASMGVSVGGGLVAGAALSLLLRGMLGRWAEGSALDATILVGVVLLLVAAGMLACWLPAHRAATLDPMKALRYE